MYTYSFIFFINHTLCLLCSTRLHPDGQPLLKCEPCVLTTAHLARLQPDHKQNRRCVWNPCTCYLRPCCDESMLPYARCLLSSSLMAGLRVWETKFYRSSVCVCVCVCVCDFCSSVKLQNETQHSTVYGNCRCTYWVSVEAQRVTSKAPLWKPSTNLSVPIVPVKKNRKRNEKQILTSRKKAVSLRAWLLVVCSWVPSDVPELHCICWNPPVMSKNGLRTRG